MSLMYEIFLFLKSYLFLNIGTEDKFCIGYSQVNFLGFI